MKIKDIIKNIPKEPGVYRMIDEHGVCIYVGKAKNLYSRVSSYGNEKSLNIKNHAMVHNINNIEYTVTESETEALLLEAQLIKNLQPKYNIIFKDDKFYPYIRFTNHQYPRMLKYNTKGIPDKNCYGPFIAANDVQKTISTLQNTLLLRSCPDSVFKNRQNPCIKYQIKQCSAPCVNKISLNDYKESIKAAKLFLEGKDTSNLLQDLQKKMEESAQNMEFERAAIYRDRIRSLHSIRSQEMKKSNRTHIFGIGRNKEKCIICRIYIKQSSMKSMDNLTVKNISENDTNSEIMSQLLIQFYSKHSIPEEIILGIKLDEVELIQNSLQKIKNSSVKISCKGNKFKKLIELANSNALNALSGAKTPPQEKENFLCDIEKIINLKNTPQRIEVYDNSHISGTNPVGVMIVATNTGFDKNEYRLFNIQTDKSGNDYQMMYETLIRRFHSESISELPDLLIIDGGPGHISIANEVLKEVGIDIPFVCIAKGEKRNSGDETIYSKDGQKLNINKNDKVMHLLQKLRDEAHRFAITSHRKRRSKGMKKSTLDNIPGLGNVRKKSLLSAIGGIEEIRNSSAEEIASVPGIGKRLAEIIKREIT